MKIKVCIANYGDKQIWCLEKMLQEFATFKKYSLDITIYTTVKIDNYNCKLYDEKIGSLLPFLCREDMYYDLEHYDLFLYSENDHLITEKNIDAFLKYQTTLPENKITRFIRYENNKKIKTLVDNVPHEIESFNEQEIYFQNKHQGCYLLTQKQLEHCVNTNEFLHKKGRGPYGQLEQGATDPYNKCGLIKVFPNNLKTLQELLIWHISDKYSKLEPWATNKYTLEHIIQKTK